MVCLVDVDAEARPRLEEVRTLFLAYAAEFDREIGESLGLQGFEAEVRALPGKYAPPAGCLLLALDTDDEDDDGRGRPAGCVAMRPLRNAICEMKRLYVARAWRGRGIGRVLVEAVLDRARRVGYERMRLDTVPGLTGALALYRNFGFAEIAPYSENPAPGTIFLEMSLRQEVPTGRQTP
jgi:GNAT superfamily N-acetyltransferase